MAKCEHPLQFHRLSDRVKVLQMTWRSYVLVAILAKLQHMSWLKLLSILWKAEHILWIVRHKRITRWDVAAIVHSPKSAQI